MTQRMKAGRGVLAVLTAVLLAAAVFTFPYAFDLTWSLPGAEADRTLTYTAGSLTWDSAADIDENGVIRLSLFMPDYSGVHAQNGDRVVAPGTGESTKIRILNTVSGGIRYTAVLYRTDRTEVPVTAGLTGGDSAAEEYVLPEGVTEEQVVDAVTGAVDGGSVKTVDIDWSWDFTGDGETDLRDTALGNKSVPDEVEYGLYIVVEDYNSYGQRPVNPPSGGEEEEPAEPSDEDGEEEPAGPSGEDGGDDRHVIPPKTGDDSHLTQWSVLAAVSLIALLFTAFWGRRESRETHED